AGKYIGHLKVVKINKTVFETVNTLTAGKKIIVSKNYISYNFYESLIKFFGTARIELSGTDFQEYRAIKSREEIDKIRESVRILAKAIGIAKKIIKPGISEIDLKIELDYQIIKNGAEDISFDTIVLFGKRTVYPHGHPIHNSILKQNDIIQIDCGSRYEGYCSDLSRAYYVGKCSPYFKKIYGLALSAQKLAIEMSVEGKEISEIEKFVLSVFAKHKLDKYYLHRTGHGVGIEIHEKPAISRLNSDTLKAGNIITIEPGVYLPGKFGIRIEDLLLIEKNKTSNLTESIRKEFYEIAI
nr:M24 family metallopeptidase [bacterium]